MSLRVLLADESSTIKKVFQIALQDFAVDVKSVDSGEDVIPVAKEFKPDIIFADILLQKHNGYDVSLDLKNNSELGKTPIVLMWSGFMELDEQKVKDSKADGRIEKPFEVDQLRQLVQKHVPKTQSQIISKYLSFPKLPEFENEEKAKQEAAQSQEQDVIAMPAPDTASSDEPIAMPAPKQSEDSNWDMESFSPIEEFEDTQPESDDLELADDSSSDDDNDEFQQVPIQSDSKSFTAPKIQEDSSDWVQKDISEFQMGEDILHDDSPPVQFQVPEDNESDNDFLIETNYPTEKSKTTQKPQQQSQSTQKSNEPLEIESIEEVESFSLFDPPSNFVERRKRPSVNKKEIEEMVTQQVNDAVEKAIEKTATKIIEEVVWKVVPEITKQAVERELKRLLEEDED